MITFALEKFSEVKDEIEPLLHAHYVEISTHVQHGVELSPRWDNYYAREADGSLVVFVGREAGQIIAYVVCFVAPGLHYGTCLTALPDVFYVRPDRRRGRVGVRMFQELEKVLVARGVKRWAVGFKTDHDASALFHYLGFRPVEVTYEKWLGPSPAKEE